MSERGDHEATGGEADPLFREEAVRDYVRARTRGDLLRISPAWTGWAFRVLVAAALAAVAFAAFARIDDWVGGPAVVREAGEVVALLPAAERSLLEPGQPLLLRPEGGATAVELTIDAIDPEIVGPRAAAERLGPAAERVRIEGPVTFVRATLPPAAATAGPVPGTAGRAEVRVGRQTLLSRVWSASGR